MTVHNEYKARGFFVPELFFPFSTLFLMNENNKLIWTLQKDRADKNIWTPAGGEVEFPSIQQPWEFVRMSDTALRETEEEIGVYSSEIMGPGPFAQFTALQTHNNYDAIIKHNNKSMVSRDGANSMYFYFLGRFKGEEPRCMPQPDEPEYEIVKIRELTIEDSLAAFADDSMKTFDNMLIGTRILQKILENPGPFAIPMSEFMAA